MFFKCHAMDDDVALFAPSFGLAYQRSIGPFGGHVRSYFAFLPLVDASSFDHW